MNQPNEHLETLTQIRSLMERSSRFISLSGLSGVAAGTFALLGAALVYAYLDMVPFSHKRPYYIEAVNAHKWGLNYVSFFLLTAAVVFTLAFVSGVWFTTRKAKRQGQKIWDAMAQRMLVNLLIPLMAGGVFCIVLFQHGEFGLIAPATLVFYGLALLNGGKYTLDEIRNLGIAEIALGSLGLFLPGFGLELWAIGFGALHIAYGTFMYYKYEK